MNIYSYLDYRKIIRLAVEELSITNSHFTFSFLAKEAGLQKTYLSKVLRGHADLNSDQLFKVASLLKFDDVQREFLELLLERQKTSIPARRKALDKKIQIFQMKNLDVANKLSAKIVGDDTVARDQHFSDYYFDPYISIVHIFLTIPSYASRPEIIREGLNLDIDHFRKILQTLEELGVIQWIPKQKMFKILIEHIHQPRDSRFTEVSRNLLRSLIQAQLLKVKKDLRSSLFVTFSADEGTRLQIHERFLEFMREIEGLVKTAPAENVYQLGFDFFPWIAGSGVED